VCVGVYIVEFLLIVFLLLLLEVFEAHREVRQLLVLDQNNGRRRVVLREIICTE
jgi:hypothetical protein